MFVAGLCARVCLGTVTSIQTHVGLYNKVVLVTSIQPRRYWSQFSVCHPGFAFGSLALQVEGGEAAADYLCDAVGPFLPRNG